GATCEIARPTEASTMAYLTGDGVYTFRLTASDGTPPDISSDVLVTVKPTALVARIYNLREGDFVPEGFFKVKGAADDPNLTSSFSYKLEVRPVDAQSSPYGAPVASFSTNHIVPTSGYPSDLGTLDLTRLTNGHYQLLLTVYHDSITSA